MDTGKVGILAAEAMEIFERDYAGFPDARIVEAVVIFEVRYTDEEGTVRDEVAVSSTTDSRVYQTGMCDWGKDLIMGAGEPVE